MKTFYDAAPASRCWPTATRSATSRAHVQGRDGDGGAGERHVHARVGVPPVDSYLPPQTTDPIENYGGTTCGGNLEVFRRSCNTALAEMAVNIGAPTMVATAEAFGFNNAPPFDLPRPAESVFGTVETSSTTSALLAIAGFGQGNTCATPLEMALVASAVANAARS